MNAELPAADQIADAIRRWRREAGGTLVVAIDGHGAAGKSLLAEAVGGPLTASLIHLDDFFREAGSTATPGESPMAAYYDWQRLRREVLEPLRGGERASFRAFDWERNGYLPDLVIVEPAELILLEGVSSTVGVLSDLVDRTVLVVTPESERVARLRDRIADEVWDDAWLAAERSYFAERPESWFDLVVSGSAAPRQTRSSEGGRSSGADTVCGVPGSVSVQSANASASRPPCS
jgi:uridine kinase